MFRILSLTALSVILLAAGAYAGNGPGPADEPGTMPGCRFIDEDGDGFNDLAPDADGDGIPNGLDPDYVRPEDGTGRQLGHQMGEFGEGHQGPMGFGPNGDGVGQEGLMGHRYGPGDGTGTGIGPADGTGFGPGGGDCDGTGDGAGTAQNAQTRRGGRR